MNKKIKKITAIFLTLITLISALSISASASPSKNSNIKAVEILTIDGLQYKFEEICLDDKDVIRVTNLSTNTQEILYFDESIGTLFSNGKPVAYISETSVVEENLLHSVSPLTSDPYWTYVETKYYRVTWAKSAGVIAVATAIASVLPGKGWVAVIAAIGINTLSAIAGSAVGGTVKLALYQHVIPQTATIELLYEWSFIAPTGEVYGPFSYMQT